MDENQTEFGLSYVIKQLQADIRALKIVCDSGIADQRNLEKELLKLRNDLVSLEKELTYYLTEQRGSAEKRSAVSSKVISNIIWATIVIAALAAKELYDHLQAVTP